MRTTIERLGTGRLVTLALVAATVAAVLLVGEPLARTETATPSTSRPSSAASPSPSTPAPPADPASVEEFCASFEGLTAAHGAATTEPSPATVGRLRDVASTTRDIAERTVEMPPDALLGISFVLDLFETLPDGATGAELTSSGHVPTFAEEAQADAFIAFVADRCPTHVAP